VLGHPARDVTPLNGKHVRKITPPYKTYKTLLWSVPSPAHRLLPLLLPLFPPTLCLCSRPPWLPPCCLISQTVIVLLCPCLEHAPILFSWIAPSYHSSFNSDASFFPSASKSPSLPALLAAPSAPWIPLPFYFSHCWVYLHWHITSTPKPFSSHLMDTSDKLVQQECMQWDSCTFPCSMALSPDEVLWDFSSLFCLLRTEVLCLFTSPKMY
jgi:hypothetical protein